MIARVAYFENLTEAQKLTQEDNYQRRFKAALTAQPGLIAVHHLAAADGTRVSISIWESEEACRTGGERANAVPLLPGQVGADIPSPSRAEFMQVLDSFVLAPNA